MAWWAYGTVPGLEYQFEIRFDGTNWVDVSTYVRSYETRISRSRSFGFTPPGSGSFSLDNRDGRFTPLNGSSPYAGNLLPGRHVRYRERWNGTAYWVWYGLIDDWGDRFPQAKDGIATVTTTQPSRRLAEFRSAALGAPVGAGETTGARVSRWLTAAGWPLGSSVATGLVPVAGTVLDDDAMSGINRAVLTELGGFWCEPDGSVVFEDRYSLVANSRSTTSQCTFGPGAGEVPYVSDPDLSSGLDLVINQVTVANEGQAEETYSSTSSISTLGMVRTVTQKLIGTDRNWAAGNAEGLLRLYSTPVQHPLSVTIAPHSSPTVAFPQCLGRRIRDRVTVKTPTPWGATLTSPCWIAGVSHRGSPSSARTTTFDLEPAANYTGLALFTLDSSSLDGSHVLGW